jgi:hypothetical protein
MPNLAISSFKKGQILKCEKRPNKTQIFKENFPKYIKLVSEHHKILILCQNRPEKLLFSLLPNHFISGTLFQKSRMATLVMMTLI